MLSYSGPIAALLASQLTTAALIPLSARDANQVVGINPVNDLPIGATVTTIYITPLPAGTNPINGLPLVPNATTKPNPKDNPHPHQPHHPAGTNPINALPPPYAVPPSHTTKTAAPAIVITPLAPTVLDGHTTYRPASTGVPPAPTPDPHPVPAPQTTSHTNVFPYPDDDGHATTSTTTHRTDVFPYPDRGSAAKAATMEEC